MRLDHSKRQRFAYSN